MPREPSRRLAMVMMIVVMFPVVFLAVDYTFGPVFVGGKGGGCDGAEEEEGPFDAAFAVGVFVIWAVGR